MQLSERMLANVYKVLGSIPRTTKNPKVKPLLRVGSVGPLSCCRGELGGFQGTCDHELMWPWTVALAAYTLSKHAILEGHIQ